MCSLGQLAFCSCQQFAQLDKLLTFQNQNLLITILYKFFILLGSLTPHAVSGDLLSPNQLPDFINICFKTFKPRPPNAVHMFYQIPSRETLLR